MYKLQDNLQFFRFIDDHCVYGWLESSITPWPFSGRCNTLDVGTVFRKSIYVGTDAVDDSRQFVGSSTMGGPAHEGPDHMCMHASSPQI